MFIVCSLRGEAVIPTRQLFFPIATKMTEQKLRANFAYCYLNGCLKNAPFEEMH